MTSAQPNSSPWRFLLPSVRDIVFISLFWSLLSGPLSNRPLADPDIGWHIRTGERILATHSLPRTDPFSFTMQGQPWFAWEWLYDVMLGILHRACGLNGVVWLCAVLVAATFTLLLSQLLRRGSGLLLAIVLMLVAEAAATIHLYARPHIVSWLFSLLWFVVLEKWEQRPLFALRCSSFADRGLHGGQRLAIGEERSANSEQRTTSHQRWEHATLPRWLPWFFPASMWLWVNLHGGWLFGLALLGIYTFAAFVESWRERDASAAIRARAMAAAWLASALATLANPHGWRLHAHIYRYLSDRYLMAHIEEFRSPDFHGWAERCFAVIMVLTLVAFANHRTKLRISSLLVVLLAAYAGFYSARNLPVSSMLLVLIAGPILWENSAALADKPEAWSWLRNLTARISNFSERMGAQELELRGHLWAVVSVVFALAICLQGGWLGSRQLIHAQFDPKKMPVAAVNFLQRESLGEQPIVLTNALPNNAPIFSTDAWGGYLIYSMYPARKVVVDDRHDLYGSGRIRQYMVLTQGQTGWQSVLDEWQVRTALLPTDSTLANLLRELPQDWRVAYEDKVAVVFEKR
jgi:ABC-type multidrug transport system fused ATPase/permease subunit